MKGSRNWGVVMEGMRKIKKCVCEMSIGMVSDDEHAE